MLLLSRPPYLRWIAASLIVLSALAWDLSRRATEPYPFAATTIAEGSPITEDQIRWEPVPKGSLDRPVLDGVHALTDILEGDPITASLTGTGAPIPPDWWTVPVELPMGIPRGTPVRLTTLDGVEVEGIVAIGAEEDQFGLSTRGSIAVPENVASIISLAAASDALVVLVAP